MGDPQTNAEPAAVVEAPTQRLAFDSEEYLKEVPQFLKKGIVSMPHYEEEDNPEDLEPKAATPISVDNSTENEEMKNREFGTSAGAAKVNPAVNDAALQSLAEMSIEQLKAQQAEIDRKIQEKQAAEKTAVIDQITAVMQDYNISLETLVEALGGIKLRRKGTKAKIKYQDPATGATWSGRGKEPNWIKGVPDRTPFEI